MPTPCTVAEPPHPPLGGQASPPAGHSATSENWGDKNGFHEWEPLLALTVQDPPKGADADGPTRHSLHGRKGHGATSSPEAAGSSHSGSLQGHNATSALTAETVYCLVSAGTILFNKHALSTFEFPAPNALLTFQFAVAVLLLKGLHVAGLVQLEPLRWDFVRLWFPVNIVFVLMNATGFYALASVSAGMFTVLKNLSNLMTIVGDWYFFDKTYNWQVWSCLGLMIVSAALGGWSDLSFSASGYAWQLVNCAFTAAYSLHLSAVVRAAAAGGMAGPPQSPTAQPGQGKLLGGGKAGAGGPGLAAVDSGGGHSPPPYGGGAHLQSTVVHPASPNKSSGIYYRSHSNGIGNGPGSGSAFGFGPGAAAGVGAGHEGGPPSAAGGGGAGEPAAHPGAPGRKRLSELSMVYYNNVLSVPPLLLLSLAFGEPRRLASYTHFSSPEFGVVVLLGALLGFGVSFASIWCMSRTSATLYSLTGSMNKVVVALVGMWWFAEPATPTNLLSIGLGLAAGFLFVFAKTGARAMWGKEG